MKGAFELSLVLTFGMMMLLGSISIVGVMMSIHHGRFFQEMIVATIEGHHAFNQDTIMEFKQYQCKECLYHVEKIPTGQYLVSVSFPIRVPLVFYQSTLMIKGVTTPIP